MVLTYLYCFVFNLKQQLGMELPFLYANFDFYLYIHNNDDNK